MQIRAAEAAPTCGMHEHDFWGHVDIGTEYHKNFSKPTLERDTRTSKFLVDTRTAPATLERPMATLERDTKRQNFL